MKGMAEIPLVGLIGTITIIAGILIPPTVVTTTIDNELVLTYKWEKAQGMLLTLFSLEESGDSAYQRLGEKLLFDSMFECKLEKDCPEDFVCSGGKCILPTEDLKDKIDKIAGEKYCITAGIVDEGNQADEANNEILKDSCNKRNTNFVTLIVLPYNKENLVKNVAIGVE